MLIAFANSWVHQKELEISPLLQVKNFLGTLTERYCLFQFQTNQTEQQKSIMTRKKT